jgi:hypothetical protein
MRRRNPSDIEAALAGAYHGARSSGVQRSVSAKLPSSKEQLAQQLWESYHASTDDPEAQKIIMSRLRRLATKNPESGMSADKTNTILAIADGLHLQDISVEQPIACGDYGCAFLTNVPGVVVKIGSQWSEYKFARAIIKRKLTHPSLPAIHGVVDLRDALGVPYYAIIREDVPDLADIDTAWFNEVLADLEYRSEDADSSEELFAIAADILATRPGAPSDELQFERVADLTAWCYDQGILLGDTLASNFGQSSPGTIKLRDLGGARFLA